MSGLIGEFSTRAVQSYGDVATDALDTIATGIKEANKLGIAGVEDAFELASTAQTGGATKGAIGEPADFASPGAFLGGIKDPAVLDAFSETAPMRDVRQTLSDPQFNPVQPLQRLVGAEAMWAALFQLSKDSIREQKEAKELKSGDSKASITNVANLPDSVQGTMSSAIPQDINSLIQHVLRESYLETTKDLKYYADKVKEFNQVKEGIRDISQSLNSVGDDAQLANVDLQNTLQKEQQTMPDASVSLRKLAEMQSPIQNYLELHEVAVRWRPPFPRP